MLSRKAVIEEVSSWAIEAKEEDNDRYFYHFQDVDTIERGLKNYVIGRKGTGKTAIAEYINNKSDYNVFSKILSFKNFPFNILYDLNDPNYTSPNQYITIWEFVIYNSICSMMANNNAVHQKSGVDLKAIFNVSIEKALSKSIKEITKPGFALEIFGASVGLTPGQQVDGVYSWRDKSDSISNFVKENIDDSTYYIMFDALDEDYKDVLEPDRKQRYFELLVGLFKAVQNVRFFAQECGAKIIPVIFLRDDIFDLCRDPDKNKWMDRSVELKWDVNALSSLIAFRITRAGDPSSDVHNFRGAWNSLFTTDRITLNKKYKRSEDLFRFMLRSTFHRPRDVISYVRSCAHIAKEQGVELISTTIIKDADESHSAYMRREVIDELYPIIDDIGEVLDIFSEMRKQIFSLAEFSEMYEQMYKSKDAKRTLGPTDILKLLYHFNVVGNITTANHQVFAYNSHKKSFNVRENICIHRGLLKSLHIL